MKGGRLRAQLGLTDLDAVGAIDGRVGIDHHDAGLHLVVRQASPAMVEHDGLVDPVGGDDEGHRHVTAAGLGCAYDLGAGDCRVIEELLFDLSRIGEEARQT